MTAAGAWAVTGLVLWALAGISAVAADQGEWRFERRRVLTAWVALAAGSAALIIGAWTAVER